MRRRRFLGAGLAGFAALAVPKCAAAATHLLVSNDGCLISACPATHVPAWPAVDAGSVFPLIVVAVDDAGSRDASYTGTVHFASSDPGAVLPGDYTFTAADEGGKGYDASFARLGTQSITATDAADASVQGTLTLAVRQVGPCVPAETVLCLDGARFRADAWWRRNGSQPVAAATAVVLTANTGYFWFFGPSNVELVVKVLDGCTANGHHWVFAGGLTDTEVALTVTDTATGAFVTYVNPSGNAFSPVQDATSLACP